MHPGYADDNARCVTEYGAHEHIHIHCRRKDWIENSKIEILFETDTTLQEVQVHWKLKMLFNMIPGTKIIQFVLRH